MKSPRALFCLLLLCSMPCLCQTEHAGLPVNEPRPFPDIFPRSKAPAADISVCNLRGEPRDRSLMFLTLQGIVNRTRPEIYCLVGPTDQQWLDWMLQNKWVKNAVAVKDNDQLLQRYRSRIKGMIITDPELPASINVATMIASLDDGIVVSPDLAKQISLPVLDDLRGKWTTSADAYRWAFENLWPRLNHYVIASVWPNILEPRDYLVENKVFTFFISGPNDRGPAGSSDAEMRLMEQLLAKMPVNIPVMGYTQPGIGEGAGISLFAGFGKYSVGTLNCDNLSMHSGISVLLRKKPAPPLPKLDANKDYLSWVISDGDNLPVLMTNNFPQLWKESTRGKVPLGWSLSPSASVLIPDIVSYYYDSATPNDEFLSAVSGVGYTYPVLYGDRYSDRDRQKVFDGFLRQTATYMKRSGMTDLWLHNDNTPDIFSQYAEQIPFLNAIFSDYCKRVSTYAQATYPTDRGVGVFHGVTSCPSFNEARRIGNAARIKQMVDDIHTMTPSGRPAFMHAFVMNWFFDLSTIQAVMDQLGPNYVAVRPDQLGLLYREYLKKEQVWSQFPSPIAVIEHDPIELVGRLRNESGGKRDVRIRSVAGIEQAVVDPAEAKLAPDKEAGIRLRGAPTGDPIELELSGAFGKRLLTIVVHNVARAELAQPLLPAGTLSPVLYLDAKILSHRSGVAEPDPSANGGAAWVARKGTAAPGYIVSSPNSMLEKGKYLALFRLKRLDEGAGQAAVLDTSVGGGGPVNFGFGHSTGRLLVNTEDLPLNTWRWFPVVFNHPGGSAEMRVQWFGNASLAVDAVALWKIEGGD